MRAGTLRHHVRIFKPRGIEQFGIGEELSELIRTCSAYIEPRAGGERVNGQQLQQWTSHVIRVRRSPAAEIDATCWIEDHRLRRYEIRSVINDMERDAELVLLCDEVTPANGQDQDQD